MVQPAETIGSGAPKRCEDCGVALRLEVLQSEAGYYLGTECGCGPYSRETDYFKSRADAEKELEALRHPPSTRVPSR